MAPLDERVREDFEVVIESPVEAASEVRRGRVLVSFVLSGTRLLVEDAAPESEENCVEALGAEAESDESRG